MRWQLCPTALKEVQTANGEPMIITRVCQQILMINQLNLSSEIFVMPNLDHLTFGTDWFCQQGRITLDFETGCIQLGENTE